MRKARGAIVRTILFLAGFFFVFNVHMLVLQVAGGIPDVMGPAGLWERPYVYLAINFLPMLILPDSLPVFLEPAFLLRWLVGVGVLAGAIALFERTRLPRRRWTLVAFYLLILPPALFLVLKALYDVF
ncbi:MAG TPA: hypothetical protein VEA36_00980 [Candidatus Paceibacterota bacterium]|nr:hypothetical protein [Candidatus Paceibacterota bacterium]